MAIQLASSSSYRSKWSYDVDPSEVRNQKGRFAKAFAKNVDVNRHSEERIQRWRTALNKVANLCGWHLGDESEASFIERIVEGVWNMGREIVHRESPNDPGQRSRLWFHEDILQVLEENAESNKVEGIKLILSEPEEVQFTPKSFEKMKSLRILIINNAQCSEHFPALSVLCLGDNNITAIPACLPKLAKLKRLYVRNCRLLQEIPELPARMWVLDADGCESLQRWSQLESMLRDNGPAWIIFADCYKLIETHGDQLMSILRPEGFVRRRKLIVIPGSAIPEWFSHKSTKSSISFRAPLGTSTDTIALVVGICGRITPFEIQVFINDMGREIVHRESPNDPGQRSRLFLHEDILQVLQDNAGSNKVESIKLTLSEPEEVPLIPKSFKKMKRLRILILNNAQCSGDHLEYLPSELRWLEWSGYPFSSLAVNFSPKKLVVFNMCSSRQLCHPVSTFKQTQ
ncbi:hypothetical protein L6164_017319 [Bauhinia variegata]|uniref:Uncharacterized protein n=1 Tax=Bauhinia variegata TaxID=167791 RepID=A0ACB9N9D7_BAUVA|nr:hypothetical protein L6164_017319 [Bauhinia variegata]